MYVRELRNSEHRTCFGKWESHEDTRMRVGRSVHKLVCRWVGNIIKHETSFATYEGNSQLKKVLYEDNLLPFK